MKTRILFSTIDNAETARRIASTLVEERLAACVNIIPNVTSVYKWKGEIETASEWLMLIKTVQERVPALIARLVQLHPYEVPEAVVLNIEEGHSPYLDWVIRETAGAG